ncbi:MAG: MarR family winged helix-turn-helix transcriptional regulator [Erysipelotrichaceae bacterium]
MEEAQKLEHQLCFALYASSREIMKRYKPLLDPFQLTYTQYITLLVLWEKSPISVKDLGLRLRLDSGTLTPLLKKLESMDLVSRRRSEEDDRVVLVTLTEQGMQRKVEMAHIPEAMIGCIPSTTQDLVALKQQLDALLDTL